jgi:hypothetical protein
VSAYSVQCELEEKLALFGLKLELITEAASGSCYLAFQGDSMNRMGKIRIGDHPERQCYGYRWQIRLDIDSAFEDSSKGHRQFFYPATALDDAVAEMVSWWHMKVEAIPDL